MILHHHQGKTMIFTLQDLFVGECRSQLAPF